MMNDLAPGSSVHIGAGAARRTDQLMLTSRAEWPTIGRARFTTSLCPRVLSAYDRSGGSPASASTAVPPFADSACLDRP
jgi:hypothetical protein